MKLRRKLERLVVKDSNKNKRLNSNVSASCTSGGPCNTYT